MILSEDSRESWDGKLIARAYKNPSKYVKELKKEGYNPKIMLDFSGILLESLQELGNNKFLDKLEVEGEKIGDIIELYKEILKKYPDSVEIAGTAYSHCYFPTTPEDDLKLQIEEWRETFKRIFGRKNLERVKGFWFPEMGIPGFENKLHLLIKAVKEYYEWCILPLQAIEGYENLSYKERIKTSCMPHLLEIKDQSIPIIFRIPTYFIDQQSGCEANELYTKLIEAGKIFSNNKPAFVVSASDGENGNVMANEFFPKTFVPFFKEKLNNKISSYCVTDFLHEFYSEKVEIKPTSKIKVKTIGASWVDTHEFWSGGLERTEMVKKIRDASNKFHEIERRLRERKIEKEIQAALEETKHALLISETSCYVYWGTDFWFAQGEQTLNYIYKKIQNLINEV
jgi:hypothetical protein